MPFSSRFLGACLCVLGVFPAARCIAAVPVTMSASDLRTSSVLPAETAAGLPTLRLQLGTPPLERGLFLVAAAGVGEPDPADSGLAGQAAAASEPAPVSVAAPDWPGLWRDTGYLIGYQLLGFGILYCMPESVSNWSTEDKTNYDFTKYRDNVSNPVFDHDDWYINYVLHPYWGSAYYLDARGRGFGRWGSFFYAFFASSLYEFGTEAFAEPASVQDVFVTPIGGALLGICFEDYWGELRAKGAGRSWDESVLLFLMDPLGQTNRQVDRLLGFGGGTVAVGLQPRIGRVRGRDTYTGLELSLGF